MRCWWIDKSCCVFVFLWQWVFTEQACSMFSMVSVPLYDSLGPDACKYIIKQGNHYIQCIHFLTIVCWYFPQFLFPFLCWNFTLFIEVNFERLSFHLIWFYISRSRVLLHVTFKKVFWIAGNFTSNMNIPFRSVQF